MLGNFSNRNEIYLQIGIFYDVRTSRDESVSLDSIHKIIATNPQIDIFVGEEYLHFGFNSTNRTWLSDREYDIILDKYQQISKEYPDKLFVTGSFFHKKDKDNALNSIFICGNGELILEYSKKNITKIEKNEYGCISGQTSGIFEWNEMFCGVEICVDHYHKELRKETSKLDLQIVVASSLPQRIDYNLINPGGCLIINDGRRSRVYSSHIDTLDEIDYEQELFYEDSGLEFRDYRAMLCI